MAETLFMGWCTAHWAHPGGTALAKAAYERRRPFEEAAAAQRAKAKWIGDVRARAYVGIPLDDISTSWTLTYVSHGKTPADGYDLQVRPMTYVFTGIRSLLTEGTIHVTWEDRLATRSDPLAEECEIDPNTPCRG